MRALPLASSALRQLLDFALPPRCPGCGTIVDDVHSFCAECWTKIEFLGPGGCERCGLPLEATDADTCAACLARPPRLDQIRAAVLYDDVTRGVALRLKYGRKVALAKTMARYMTPLVGSGHGKLFVPVPLHRRRLWQRGFNQAVFIASEVAKRCGGEVEANALRRVKRTPPLKGLSRLQRRRAVAGAFKVDPATELRGRTVVLVDDVFTTGSTANACARALQRAGATRVEFVSWARVVRPAHIES